MGQAKIKREREEARRREERERQKALRPKEYRPLKLTVEDPERPQYTLGTFELHLDGRVYQVVTQTQKGGRQVDTGQRRRVKDQRVIDAVHARYAELHADPKPAAAVPVA